MVTASFSSSVGQTKRVYQSDRFIPARSAMDFDLCHMITDLQLDDSTALNRSDNSSHRTSYKELLDATFLPRSNSLFQPRPLLAIRTSATRNCLNVNSFHRFHPPAQVPLRTNNSSFSLPSSVHVIDAPDLRNDFYLNLMDWGENNIIAIGLNQNVYLYVPTTGEIQTITACTNPIDYVTSVKWSENTSKTGHLAVGTFLSELQIWDVETMTQIRSLRSHTGRIGSLSWSRALASGSRDAIHLNDVRCAHHLVTKLAHRGEICGLAWSPDSDMLASGSSKNHLCIWDNTMLRSNELNPLSCHEHCAPVRALAWSPWQRLVLASGGGTADGTIRLWRAATGKLVRSVSTESQVCALAWSTTTRELLSAHGHGSDRHEIALWRGKTMQKAHEFTGHRARALHVAISPDGSTVVSAGADETMRFWNVFPSKPSCSRWNGDLLNTTTAIR
ncbi:hypothetical protein JG688_00013646 [Phytophthora aleatoria]|uniref:CDC20/Fizzy WD40 domain-containing protein n=1 Tax=Phytophthora aleatoria TaxID=2496075 RepID=A0A8J5ILX4_9STRA|nr:hypothetical protein JG688_00013646 [Phytophthora aleatoria]